MATNVTSLVSIESAIPNRWVRKPAGIFVMTCVANLRCAWAPFPNPPVSSSHANFAAPVRRHSAEPLKSFRTAKIRLSRQRRSDVRRIRKCGASPQCGRESALFH